MAPFTDSARLWEESSRGWRVQGYPQSQQQHCGDKGFAPLQVQRMPLLPSPPKEALHFRLRQKLKVGICWILSCSGRSPAASKPPLLPSPKLSPILAPSLSTPRSQMGFWGAWKELSIKGFTGYSYHPIAKSTSICCILTMSGILLGTWYSVCYLMCPREVLLFIPHFVIEETSPCNLVTCLRLYSKARIWTYQLSSQGYASQCGEAE